MEAKERLLMANALAREFSLAHTPARDLREVRAVSGVMQHETLESAQHETLEAALTRAILNVQWPQHEFEAYVRAMPQGEAQTALIFLVNYLADLGARGRILGGDK